MYVSTYIHGSPVAPCTCPREIRDSSVLPKLLEERATRYDRRDNYGAYNGEAGNWPVNVRTNIQFPTPKLYAVTLMTILLTTAINDSIWLLSRRVSMWRIR